MPLTRMPPLLSLRAFEAAARRGSFKDAASELSVTPGAVSQQIKTLEADLGVDLFVRKTRAIELTPEGRRLQPDITDSFMKMRDAVDNVRPSATKEIQIHAAGMIIRSWLLPRMHRFTAFAPNVKTQINTLHSWESFDYGENEVAFRLAKQPPKGVYARKIHELLMVPLASPKLIAQNNVTAASDVLRLPLLQDVVFEKFDGTPAWQKWFQAAGINDPVPNYAMTFDAQSADYALDVALDGNGVILGWSIQCYQALAQGRLRVLCGPVLETGLNYYLMCNETQAKRSHISAFLDWAEGEAALLSTMRSLQAGAA